MISEDVIRKIKKLLSLASSSNENEAANAVAKAQDLAFQHDLELSYVEGYNLNKDNQIDESAIAAFGGRVAMWKQELFYVVGRTSLCKSYLEGSQQYGHRGMLIGRKSDVEVAKYTFEFLINELERLSQEFMADQVYYDKAHSRHLRRSWLEGAVMSIRFRLDSEFNKRKTATEQSTALVVSRDSEIKDYLESRGLKFIKSSSSYADVDGYAYRQGKETGASISLRPGLAGSRGSRQIQ